MSVSIVIPYRDLGVPERRDALAYVCRYYATWLPSAEILVEGDVEPFTRARAINRGVERAESDVLLQVDPDSLVPPAQLDDAVRFVLASDGLVVPHDNYRCLDQAATREVLAGADFSDYGHADCEEWGGPSFGKALAFSRRTWEVAGGFDERFPLWGGDDSAFAYACDAYFGDAVRVPGPVFHLWHPRLPESIPGDPRYAEQFAILEKYRDAAETGREAVRELVENR